VHPFIVEETARLEAERSNSASNTSTATSKTTRSAKYPSLIERYNLRDRIADQTISSISSAISRSNKGKGREVDVTIAQQEEDSQDQLTLLQRKQRLILESRRKLMEKLLRDKANSSRNDSTIDSELRA